MPTSPLSAFRPSRSSAAAATIALHLALIGLWQLAKVRQVTAPDADRTPPIQWIKLPPPAPVQARHDEPAPPRAAAARAAAIAAKPATAAEPPALTLVPAPAEPPARSAADILGQARRDAGKIDRELRKESLNQIHAPADTPMTRLAAGIDAATAAPKLWEAPRVSDEMDQGQYGRRIYKVKGALGTYCIYNETNHAPDGLDSMKNGLHPKIMTCPREK